MRKFVAAAWLLGSTACVLALAVFLFGCCVLPFHSVLHRVLPMCAIARGVLSGEHHEHHAVRMAPKPVPVIATAQAAIDRDESVSRATAVVVPNDDRNTRTLGALRVDDDIGLHALLVIFLI